MPSPVTRTRQLVQAEVALLQATLDYQSAAVAFEAIQEAPALASAPTIGLRGTTIVAMPPALPGGVVSTSTSGIF